MLETFVIYTRLQSECCFDYRGAHLHLKRQRFTLVSVLTIRCVFLSNIVFLLQALITVLMTESVSLFDDFPAVKALWNDFLSMKVDIIYNINIYMP